MRISDTVGGPPQFALVVVCSVSEIEAFGVSWHHLHHKITLTKTKLLFISSTIKPALCIIELARGIHIWVSWSSVAFNWNEDYYGACHLVAPVEGAMWTGDNLWHRIVISHNSNCMELELAPKGKDMSSLLVFSTLEAINLSLNIQKDHFFFQKSIPWGLYYLRKVIYTSAIRLRASKLHCPLWLRSEVGKRGSQHCRYVY